MGSQIIRQPNGMYAIFSSITDTIIMWDASSDEIVDYFVERAAKSASSEARSILEVVSAGEARKAYFQFAMTWEEALTMDAEHGGEVWSAVQDQTQVVP